MYHRLYQRPYQCQSAPVHPTAESTVRVRLSAGPVYGVPGARSPTFATPGPWAVPCLVLLLSLGTDARGRSLRPRGQGYAPAPRLAVLARRWRVVKPAPCCLAIPLPLATQGGAGGDVWRIPADAAYSFPPFPMPKWTRLRFGRMAARVLGSSRYFALPHQTTMSGAEDGPRILPTITLSGKRYFIDERLRQLRNTADPHDFVDLA